jgi:anaerobic ribonucleoside-triphosphate reductase activating protein
VEAGAEIAEAVMQDHCSGLRISGGDPLHIENRKDVTIICKDFKNCFPEKTIWVYTGYTWEQVKHLEMMKYIDVLVDGKFVQELADVRYNWAGSTNQRIINVQDSLKLGKVVLED